MLNMNSENISIVALILSGISLFISWRQFDRDRSRIKLSLEFLVETGMGSAYILDITNTGRRITTITQCYAKLASNSTYYPISDTETALGETQNTEVVVPLHGFKNSISHPLDIELFAVEDTTGKRHIIKTASVRKEINRVWTPEVDWLTSKD